MKPKELKELLSKPKRNKYGAVKKEFNGVIYHSTLEAEFAKILEYGKKGGFISHIDRQVPIQIIVNGSLICKYIIDFKVSYSDGSVIFWEVKGKTTPDFILKWKLAKAIYKDFDFQIYPTKFQRTFL